MQQKFNDKGLRICNFLVFGYRHTHLLSQLKILFLIINGMASGWEFIISCLWVLMHPPITFVKNILIKKCYVIISPVWIIVFLFFNVVLCYLPVCLSCCICVNCLSCLFAFLLDMAYVGFEQLHYLVTHLMQQEGTRYRNFSNLMRGKK